MFKKDDEVLFFDTSINHIKGKKGSIVAVHPFNCVTISYNDQGIDGLLIQVNNSQVIKQESKNE